MVCGDEEHDVEVTDSGELVILEHGRPFDFESEKIAVQLGAQATRCYCLCGEWQTSPLSAFTRIDCMTEAEKRMALLVLLEWSAQVQRAEHLAQLFEAGWQYERAREDFGRQSTAALIRLASLADVAVVGRPKPAWADSFWRWKKSFGDALDSFTSARTGLAGTIGLNLYINVLPGIVAAYRREFEDDVYGRDALAVRHDAEREVVGLFVQLLENERG